MAWKNPQSIGVGKVALPALRTVRAVLPHTALQSPVPTSGMSRLSGAVSGDRLPFREGVAGARASFRLRRRCPAPTSCDPSRSKLPPPRLTGIPAGDACPLFSLEGTYGTPIAAYRTSRIQLPASLPSGRFCYPPLSTARSGLGNMKALTPDGLTRTARSHRLLRLAVPTFRPQPRDPPAGRFVSRLSAVNCSRLRHT
jgi:hypothetical protein